MLHFAHGVYTSNLRVVRSIEKIGKVVCNLV
jgi:hypothetical protein